MECEASTERGRDYQVKEKQRKDCTIRLTAHNNTTVKLLLEKVSQAEFEK
jgi:hypothetical protein